MSTFSKLLAFDFLFILLSCVLYVLFGQVTVRKLRKKPKTKILWVWSTPVAGILLMLHQHRQHPAV